MIISLLWGRIFNSGQPRPNSALTKGSLDLYQHLQALQKFFWELTFSLKPFSCYDGKMQWILDPNAT